MKNLILKYNPIKILLIILVKLYQVLIGPIKPAVCKYHPSCSNYFLQALQKKGLVKGVLMGIWRILRCNPFSRGGYDPVVPDEKKESVTDQYFNK